MQNIISIQRSFSDQYYQDLESQIRFLNQRVRNLEQHIEQLSQLSIAIPMVNGNQIIMIDQIVYCQASSNYTNIHLEDGRRICVSKTLKFIQSLLPDQKFIRIHQSHLVSIRHIAEYHLGARSWVRLNNSEIFPISKSGYRRVHEKFSDEYNRGNSSIGKNSKHPYQLKVINH